MILYALRCAAGHGFEGWFPGSASFEAQSKAGRLACPECGTDRVDRALMAPAVATRSRAVPQEVAERPAAAAPPPSLPDGLPDALRGALQRLRAEVEARSDHVGSAFASQALAMHRGEIDHRAIHGDATERERAELEDEGVEVQVIPWVPRADA